MDLIHWDRKDSVCSFFSKQDGDSEINVFCRIKIDFICSHVLQSELFGKFGFGFFCETKRFQNEENYTVGVQKWENKTRFI